VLVPAYLYRSNDESFFFGFLAPAEKVRRLALIGTVRRNPSRFVDKRRTKVTGYSIFSHNDLVYTEEESEYVPTEAGWR
jgi:hypothetical protein